MDSFIINVINGNADDLQIIDKNISFQRQTIKKIMKIS